MADARIEKWMKGAVGRGMNLDQVYGYQCVDVINDYGNTLFGSWEKTVGRGNAKDKYGIMPTTYWTKIKNDPKNPKQIPQKGDVIAWDGWAANPVGHIAVVESADQSGVNVIQQDGITNTRPTHRARLPYVLGGKLPIGWLRPKLTTVTTKTIKTETTIPFTKEAMEDPSKLLGVKTITQPGVNGVKTTTYKVTYTNGKETKRETVSSAITTAPVVEITLVGTKTVDQELQETVKENNALLKQILSLLNSLISKITSIFR